MKNIILPLIVASLAFVTSCDRELESEGIAEGIIRYPSIEIVGDSPFVLQAGTAFEDPGAKAFLGADDITPELEVDSGVDSETPGVYTVQYSVSTINELDQTSSVTSSRFVSVTDGDVCGLDISGGYARNTNGIATSVEEVACGVFASDNFFATPTFTFTGLMFHIGNNELIIPEQDSPYGRYAGSGMITDDGFQFVVELLDQGNAPVTRIFVPQ